MTPNDETTRILMMKALDGYLTDVELARWEQLLSEDDALRAEFEELEITSNHLTDYKERMLNDYRGHEVERGAEGKSRLVAALMGLGLLTLWGGWAYTLLSVAEVPLWVKVGLGTITLGLSLAMFTVVRDRLQAAPHDRYTEVDR